MFNKSQLFFIYKTKSVNLFQEMTHLSHTTHLSHPTHPPPLYPPLLSADNPSHAVTQSHSHRGWG